MDVGVVEGMDEEWERGAGRGNPLLRGSEVQSAPGVRRTRRLERL